MIFGKKNKDEIREFFKFNYTDLTAIEEYLTLKEKEGLRLKEIDGEKMVFKKAEPQEAIRYCAEIYTGSLGDDFISSCEQEGWINCGIYHDELYIFRTNQINATDIMTDEELKMKTIKKRALLRPGNFFWFFILLLRVLNFALDVDIGLNESNIVYWLWWIVIVFSAYRPACIVINYIIWLIKAKTALRHGEETKFMSLSYVKVRDFIENLFSLLLSLGAIAFICIVASGYCEDGILVCWLIIGWSSVNLYALISKVRIKTTYSKAVKIFSFILIMELIIWGTYMFSNQIEKNTENSKTVYNTINIPLSLSDLGYNEKDCIDKCMRSNITRFAQHYFYSSDYEEESTEDETPQEYEEKNEYMFYEIFVSDYDYIREKYINEILKKYEKYDNEIKIISGDETSWDVCYREADKSGEDRYAGFAIKGNTIFFTDIFVDTNGTDLFETAYEKLFDS